jgi:lipoprotein-anchoring transpeptidase ErfK/SrfK
MEVKQVEKKIASNFFVWLLAAALALATGACWQANESTNQTANREGGLANSNRDTDTARQPVIEATPTEAGENSYRVVTGEKIKLTVRARDAREVEILYQPVFASDRFLNLTTLTQPGTASGDIYETEIQTPEDFNGEVWARVRYRDGETKLTEHLLLATRSSLGEAPGVGQAQANTNNNQANANTNQASAKTAASNANESNAKAVNGVSAPSSAANSKSASDDESARTDRATGGGIQHTALKSGDGDIRITVNVPAFHLTLWQSGKEIATYPVGVGRKAFPIPSGERTASQIILNPAWIPPDSEWVRESSSVEPYERIPASDPQNPLGKIKIPLGDAYLLHEAESPADLGNLVSHGCVRVLREDLFDLTRKIAQARAVSGAKEKIERARNSSERMALDIGGPLVVDINYDTMVVEGGTLHLFPDVYGRNTNTVEKLREELGAYHVDLSRLDDGALKDMLNRVSDEQQFVVKLADIKAGRGLERGKNEALTPQQAKQSAPSKKRKASG